MSNEQNPLEGATFHDPRLEYQEQQRQKRIEFEADQERKRQEFEVRLEAQKAKREWLMLIITVAAVVTSAISAYDGRQARIQAKLDADKALKSQEVLADIQLQEARRQATQSQRLQKQGVDAQIQATRLDERPYVIVEFDHFEICSSAACKADSVELNLRVIGRTPALAVQYAIKCSDDSQPFRAKTKFAFLPLTVGVVPVNGAPLALSSDCPGGVSNNPSLVFVRWVYGTVRYKDIFDVKHSTEFCYELYPSEDNLNSWVPCDNFMNTLK